MNSHDFDDIIKQKAQQREADVPEDIWEAITKEKKKRRFPFFWLTLIILFLGESAIIWTIKNKTISLQIANVEKANGNKTNPANEKEQVSENKIVSTVGPADGNEKIDSANLVNTAVINKKEIQSAKQPAVPLNNGKAIDRNKNDSIGYIPERKENPGDSNKIDNADKKSIRPNEQLTAHSMDNDRTVEYKSKKQEQENANKINGAGKAERVSKTHHKQKTNAAYKLKIINGEIDDLTDPVVINGIDHNIKIKTDQPSGIIAKEPLTAELTTNKTNLAGEADISKTGQSIQTSVNDSLLVQKTISLLKDSAEKKSIVQTQIKKSKDKYKINGLKIEAGITAVFPIQHYEQPLYVKRILNTPGVRSEFVADNIKTSVETGAGFNVQLIKQLNKKWSAGAGIHYLRFTEILQMSGIETNTNYTVVERLVSDNGNSFLKSDTVSAITKTNTVLNGRNIYNNFGIPLFMRYNLIAKKKWSCAITAGIYIDLVRKYHNNIPGQFETPGKNNSGNSENSIGFDAFSGLHFTGALYKKYEWFTEAAFDYNFTAYKTNDLSFNKKIHIPGISFGIAYKIK